MNGPSQSNRSTAAVSTEQSTRTIFPSGPSYTLDNFSSRDFIVKDFVEQLTDGAQSSTRRSLGTTAPFDPKPLIRSFEQATKRLNELSSDLEQKENGYLGAVRRAEAEHGRNAESLGRKLNHTIDSFQKLDTSLRSDRGEKWGGNVAVETGRRLEELDRQRRRALDAEFLVRCWEEVSTAGELTQLERLRTSNIGEQKIRSANIARQLLRISQRLDPKSHGQVNGTGKHVTMNGVANGVTGARHFNTREIIEKFIEMLENDMLKLFDDFYRRQNFEEMKNCATVLQDFNGGASVQAAFVNQHQFFIDRANLQTDEVVGDQETWVRLSDPDAELPGVEPGLQSLIDDVRITIQDESAIIKRAFPFPDQVLSKFVQRVFQQSIQQRLEAVLEKAESESTLAYLRSLQAARGSINILVDDLKAHGLLEHPEAISSQTSQLLDQQVEELFTPYFGGSAYIDKERHNLSELYKSLLFKFELFHSRRRREPKTYLATLRKQGAELLASAREATDQYMNSLDLEKMSTTQKRILLSVAGLKNTDKAQPDIELSEADGRLNIHFAKRMLKWLAEGVRRGLELNNGSETPKDVAVLLNLLLKKMGENYVDLALEAAADSASTAESAKSREPDLSYLSHLRAAISITHLMQSCINTLLIPLASSSLTIRREMEKTTRAAILRVEEHINTIEQRSIDAVLNWTTRLLSNQTRQDFRPREEASDLALSEPQTQTCVSLIRFLTTFYTTISSSFDGTNLTLLLTEIAIGFRTQLLDHFKKFQVNEVGAVMLARDMSAYVGLLRSWGAEDASRDVRGSDGKGGKSKGGLDASFKSSLEVLTEIGSLFVLRPEALRERLRAPVLNGVGKENLRPYLLRRDDYQSVGMVTLLNSL